MKVGMTTRDLRAFGDPFRSRNDAAAYLAVGVRRARISDNEQPPLRSFSWSAAKFLRVGAARTLPNRANGTNAQYTHHRPETIEATNATNAIACEKPGRGRTACGSWQQGVARHEDGTTLS